MTFSPASIINSAFEVARSMEVIMRPVRFIAGLILLSLLVACGEETNRDVVVILDLEEAGVLSSSLTEGSTEAVGLLNFLNDEATVYETLDIDAKLDRRSAAGLIHHRNGPDGRYGTWDDDKFDSVEEVDAVKWVGARTIDRIVGFALDNGWIPFEDDVLGIYDGVTFTVNQAEAVLYTVNEMTFEELDSFLNRRAAANIVDARPIASLEALAAVRYVGRAALDTLKKTTAKPANIVQQD
jgi:hypothetical protein